MSALRYYPHLRNEQTESEGWKLYGHTAKEEIGAQLQNPGPEPIGRLRCLQAAVLELATSLSFPGLATEKEEPAHPFPWPSTGTCQLHHCGMLPRLRPPL